MVDSSHPFSGILRWQEKEINKYSYYEFIVEQFPNLRGLNDKMKYSFVNLAIIQVG